MAEPEPVTGRHVALGDCEVTGKPRLGCEQVVAIGIQYPVGDRITNRQQLAISVEQEAEIHVERQRAGGRFEHHEARRHAVGIDLEIADVTVDCRARRADPEEQIGIGIIRRSVRNRLGSLHERLQRRPVDLAAIAHCPQMRQERVERRR